MQLQVYYSFDSYVSGVVGSEVKTGYGDIELSEEFKKQLSLDLVEQEKRLAKVEAEYQKLTAEATALKAKNEKSNMNNKNNDSVNSSKSKTKKEEEELDEEFDESLLLTNPSDWRRLDLYKLMGLEKNREKSTAEEMKAAYRRRVLLYHPDKLRARKKTREFEESGLAEDDLFKCIQKAYQALTDPSLKAQYDSCDPTFDESIPEDRAYPTDEDFFRDYRAVFERNARFSKKQPVPELGNSETPRSQVESFYSFWIKMESTRRFEWLDEEEVQGENRADKRYMEKKNKALRDKKKKDDTSRLIRLVETAMKRDPRMLRWKEADKSAKNAKKNEKESAARIKAAEEAAKIEAEKARKAAEEAEVKRLKDEAQAAKLAAKTALKTARKNFRSFIVDDQFCVFDLVKDLKLVQVIGVQVEDVISKVGEDIPRLEEMIREVKEIKVSFVRDAENAQAQAITSYLQSILVSVNNTATIPMCPVKTNNSNESLKAEDGSAATITWTLEETDLLINAAKQFPGGTRDRWEQITALINRHITNGTCKTANPSGEWSVDAVIKRANELKSETSEIDTNPTNVCMKKRDPRVDQALPTVATHYYSDDSDRAKAPVSGSVPADLNAVWSAEDQQALESAMKNVPADDAERWEKVAALVPGKSKKECVQRVKDIAAQLKAAKAK